MATREKQKAAFRKENADRRPKAHAKYVRISSRKVKIVIDLIRGKNVDEAAAILTYTPKAASPVVLKVLNSAIANAVNNLEMDRKDLYVAEVYANPGPTLKRYVARSRGSASPMLKRTSHISVVLDQKKAQAHMAARDTRPSATAKYVRISSRKVKIVIDLIRGKNVDDALAILQYTPKAAAPVVHKLLSSAIANAVNNNEMDRKSLYVAEVYANPGPTLKRYVARSRGSASPMLKRTSHISVVLDQK